MWRTDIGGVAGHGAGGSAQDGAEAALARCRGQQGAAAHGLPPLLVLHLGHSPHLITLLWIQQALC